MIIKGIFLLHRAMCYNIVQIIMSFSRFANKINLDISHLLTDLFNLSEDNRVYYEVNSLKANVLHVHQIN